MKSSKIETFFNCDPPIEKAKTLSPFTYYQPFQSSFDPEFFVPSPKVGVRQTPQEAKRRSGASGERSSVGLQMSGGGLSSPSGKEDRVFSPRSSSARATTSFAGATSSAWGEAKERGLCNSTGRTPVFPRPSERRSSNCSTSELSGSGMHPQFPLKGDVGFGSLNGGPFPIGASPYQSACQVLTCNRKSTYYPLVLGPLGKNLSQNMYKTGHNRPMMCNFCKNNKEVPDIYLNHYLYDPETKVLSCPVLRKHVCEICGGTGDQAHTLQYCPVNRGRGLQSKVPVLLKTRTITNSTGKIRRN